MSSKVHTKINRASSFATGTPIVFDSPIAFSSPGDLAFSLNGLFIYSDMPDSPLAPGTTGQRACDGAFIYECVALNTWVRFPVANWDGSEAPFAPARPTDVGNFIGERRYNAGFIYEYTAPNQWVRWAVAPWAS